MDTWKIIPDNFVLIFPDEMMKFEKIGPEWLVDAWLPEMGWEYTYSGRSELEIRELLNSGRCKMFIEQKKQTESAA